MKKIISMLLSLCMFSAMCFSSIAYAEEGAALINLDFASVKSFDQNWSAPAKYTITGGTGGFLYPTSVNQTNGEMNFATSTFTQSIGMKYVYETAVKHDQRYPLADAYVAAGTHYTAKTTINNGAYMLSFTVEKTGIYAYNKNGVWTKIWHGNALNSNKYTSVKAEVEGAKAVIYLNGEKVVTYEMPKSLTTDKFSFGVKGAKANTDATAVANPCITYFKLTSYTTSAAAPVNALAVSVESEEDVTALKNNANYTFNGKDSLKFQANAIYFAGKYGSADTFDMTTNSFTQSLGEQYLYEAYMYPNAMCTDLASGDNYTARTVITNGSYKLQFSVESDGIYIVNSNNALTKYAYPEGMVALKTWATYSASVDGSTATLYRDGKFLFSCELPADTSAQGYTFGVKGHSNAQVGTYINNIVIANYSEQQSITDDDADADEKNLFNLHFVKNDGDNTLANLVNNDIWFSSAVGTGFKVHKSIDWLELGALYRDYVKNGKAYLGRNFFAKPIGDNYIYKFNAQGSKYVISDENLASGEYYTLKTLITNGKYKLEVSFENSGIWGYDANGTWKQLYKDTDFVKQSVISSYAVCVTGSQASIYKDGACVLTYTMPADDDTMDSFEISNYGMYNDTTKTGVVYINDISLTSKYGVVSTYDTFGQTDDGNLFVTPKAFDASINEGKSYTMILAVYDGTCLKSVDFTEVTFEDITSGENLVVDYALGNSVRIFVWDGMGTMRPLMADRTLADLT